jgi:hypothetical protein
MEVELKPYLPVVEFDEKDLHEIPEDASPEGPK